MQFYYGLGSAPCRMVLLFFQALDLKPEMINVDIMNGENMTPEYLKMNPQHTVPVINDDGFVLAESRAILAYLAEKYGAGTTYYPSDPMARGVVNHRLMFDIGTLYQRFYDTYFIPFTKGLKEKDEENHKKLVDALGFLEAFMGGSPYMAGDKITVADYAIITTISTIEAVGNDLTPYKTISAWYARCKMEMKGYDEIDPPGAQMLASMLPR